MVEKITLHPQNVRGLGNIVSPKEGNDFLGGRVTSSTDTIKGIVTNYYTSKHAHTPILTVTGNHYIHPGEDLVLKCRLVHTAPEHYHVAIGNATLRCLAYDEYYELKTNSTGRGTFTIPALPPGKHTVKVYYLGFINIDTGGCFKNFNVIVGDDLELDVIDTQPIVSSEKSSEIFGILKCGEWRVPGEMVQFYEEYFSSRIWVNVSEYLLETDDNIEITASLNDADGSGIPGELVRFYGEYEDVFLLNVSKELLLRNDTSEITASYLNVDGTPVTNTLVQFYEVYYPFSLRASVSSDMVKTGDYAEITALLKDEDGSGINGEKVCFYEEYDYSDLQVTSTTNLIKREETVDITALLKDEDGSVIRDTLVCFYETD